MSASARPEHGRRHGKERRQPEDPRPHQGRRPHPARAPRGNREAARRALSLLSLPFNAPLALRLLYRTAMPCGTPPVTPARFQFYTKRATLAASIHRRCLRAERRSPGGEATWLPRPTHRRCHEIEKLKSQVKSWTGQGPRSGSGPLKKVTWPILRRAAPSPCRRGAAAPSGRRDSAASRRLRCR